MTFVDTHTHLHFEQFKADLDDLINRAENDGINQIVTAGADLNSSQNTLKIAQQYEGVFAAVGIHPSESHLAKDGDLNAIKKLAISESKVVAIGEIGLDFYWEKIYAEEQYVIFRKMLELSEELKLPGIIHNRAAHREMEWFFQEEKIDSLKGVMHCFSGDKIDARFYLDMGLHISFTGNITYPDFKKNDVVRYIPLDRILLETDSPYMTPEPYRKSRNEPRYVKLVAKKLAELFQRPVEEISEITTKNSKRLFNLP
jgi:TatD DNase family protein